MGGKSINILILHPLGWSVFTNSNTTEPECSVGAFSHEYFKFSCSTLLRVKKYIVFVAIILSILIAGCEKKEAKEPVVVDYKSEAKALCKVFNPKKWENIPKDLTPIEIHKIFSDGIQAAVHSEKMSEVVQTIPKIPAELRYKYVVENISALTGETYSCPGLEEYLSP